MMKRDAVEREWMGRVEVQVGLMLDVMKEMGSGRLDPAAMERIAKDILARQLHRLIYDVVAMEAQKTPNRDA